MNFFKILSLSAFLFGTLARAEPSGVCDGYLQLSNELKCSSENYLTQFGYRYCKAFEAEESTFTPEGQQVLGRLRVCLVNALRSSPHLTCERVAPVAYRSHIGCYLREGFCEMSSVDQMHIFWVVKEQIQNPDFQNVSRTITQRCAAKIFGYARVND